MPRRAAAAIDKWLTRDAEVEREQAVGWTVNRRTEGRAERVLRAV